MPPAEPPGPEEMARAIGVPGIERHVFLCVDTDCDEHGVSWTYLRRRLRELGLERTKVHETQARCLGICTGGPVMVVYPDGVWYRAATPQNIERIVTEHLDRGEVVEDLVIVRSPLGHAETTA